METYPKTVALKTGKEIILNKLQNNDMDALINFFQSLPQKDRMFLRIDVMKKNNIMRRYGHFNYDIMFPVIASTANQIVGIGTLWRAEFGWMRNLGEIRCVVSPDFQRNGLCTILVRELFLYALTTNLNKIQAEIMEDQKSAISAFERMGFHRETVLKKHVTDINGDRRNLVIMSLDIVELWNLMEDHTIGTTYVV